MILALLLACAGAAPVEDGCAGIEPCTLIETVPIGRNKVVQVAHTAKLPDDWDGAASMGEECLKRTYRWIPPGGPARPILTVCNDGYGASMTGEDLVEIAEGRFFHHQNGGSNSRWWNSHRLQLDPPRMLAEGEGGSHFGSGRDISWSWLTFSGEIVRSIAPGEDVIETKGRLIPSIPTAFDWKTVALGKCALQLTSASDFITHGKPGPAEDASFKALWADGTLVLELKDDTWVDSASSWVKADHVELWVGNPPGPWGGESWIHQWGVQLDGTVHAAHGSPKPVVAEVVRVSGAIRMRISQIPDHEAITVVYSDSDDGKSQERLIASSALQFAKAHTLGSRFMVRPEHAVCEAKDGLLQVRETRTFSTGMPLLPGHTD